MRSVAESNRIPTIRRYLIGAGFVLLAIGGQLLLRSGMAWLGGMLLLGSASVFAMVFRAEQAISYALNAKVAGWHSPRDWFVVTALAAAIVLAVASLLKLDVYQPDSTFWTLYIASIAPLVLVPLTILIVDYIRSSRRPGSSFYWLLGILALAVIVRFVALSSLPFGTWYDEAANGLESLRILNEPQYRPVYTDGVNSSGHYLYMIAAAFELFGISTHSIRLVSAAAGVGAVAAGYLVGRELFDRAGGLVLAFMLAISRWAINFSRLGMYNMLTPFLELFAVGFLLRALHSNRFSDYMLAGVAMGFGLCFYSAFQLFMVAVALFLALIMATEWRPGYRFFVGIAITAFSALVVIAPLAYYAYERPDSYFARIEDTSLFADKEPDERFSALVENSRKHLLMFNVRGDPNGRHNLPGEPMLDPVIAALFVIGTALSLWRIRQPVALFLLLWFVIGLLGGILSLDFEAPQSLRAISTMPVVYILATMPLYMLGREWRHDGGRYIPYASLGLVALILLPAASYNLDLYFRRQATDFASWNAFSTPETLTAKVLNNLDPDTRAYVVSLYDDHPTIRFLASDAPAHERLDTTATMPIIEPSQSGIMLILDAERGDLYRQALQVYPGAVAEEVRSPFGGPIVLYTVEVSPQVRDSIQGFTAVYQSAADSEVTVERKEPVINANWPADAPLSQPFRTEWHGVLAANSYGPYQFGLTAPGAASLYVDETLVLEQEEAGTASESLVVPKGLHLIRVEAESGDGAVRLIWRTPDREAEAVPSWSVFSAPVTNNGLLGRYFPNDSWSGEPALEQIDSNFDMYFHVPMLSRPYTVSWTGKVAIPESGKQGFALESNDESSLFIDGKLVAKSEGRGLLGSGFLDLSGGLHDIELRFADRSDHTFIKAYWIPPQSLVAQAQQVLPTAMLFPPQGSYERIAMPALTDVVQSDYSVAPQPASIADSVVAEVVAELSGPPAGVALQNGAIVVTIPELGRVTVLHPENRSQKVLDKPNGEYTEPFDLAVDANERLYVHDAASGEIVVYDDLLTDGRVLDINPEQLNRARGIDVDSSGILWVAKTPAGEVLRYDLETGESFAVPTRQHTSAFGESQPVDVAMTDDGSLFITDSGVHKLSMYTEQGMRIWSIDIPVANSFHGSHLAASAHGTVYMTVPEQGMVQEIDSNGTVLNTWLLRVEDNRLVKPVGIAVDNNEDIYVADAEGRRVLRFSPPISSDAAVEVQQ